MRAGAPNRSAARCRARRRTDVMSGKLSVLIVFAMIFVSGRACAEDVTAVRLRYTASRGCADERGFFEQVTARTQRVRLANFSEPATALVVSIREVTGGL